MNIVIPMAGLSKRFSDAGYDLPKYMLPLGGKSVFAHAVESFRSYFSSANFLFIARDVRGTRDFISSECSALGISNVNVVMLDHATSGQAHTVQLGLISSNIIPSSSAIIIFNIDTFRNNFELPTDDWLVKSSGYLEVFEGAGSNWSYVEPAADSIDPVVIRTAEKEQISNLCCNGLYYFRRSGDFLKAFDVEKDNPRLPELYIAPLYNHLIKNGKIVNYNLISEDKIVFCGVPEEYRALKTHAP